MVTKRESARYVVCVNNEGYEASLERNKIYVAVPDQVAEDEHDVRVVDESGEDYLYPESWFVRIEVPAAVQASLASTSRRVAFNPPIQPTGSASG